MPAVQEQPFRHWEITESREYLRSDDEIIDAYLRGRKHERDKKQEELQKAFENNLEQAADFTEEALACLKEQGYTAGQAYLKPNTFYDFDILITVTEEALTDREFPKVYEKIKSVEEKAEAKDLNLFFDFLDETASFNSEYIVSDGYFFKYNNNEKRTRGA